MALELGPTSGLRGRVLGKMTMMQGAGGVNQLPSSNRIFYNYRQLYDSRYFLMANATVIAAYSRHNPNDVPKREFMCDYAATEAQRYAREKARTSSDSELWVTMREYLDVMTASMNERWKAEG